MRKRHSGRLFLPIAGALLASAMFFGLVSCKDEEEPARSGNKIIGFEVAGKLAGITETSIAVTLPRGTALTQSPSVTVSPGAKVISPKSTSSPGWIFVSDAAVDFSGGPVAWTVQSESGSVVIYSVSVTAPVLTGIQISKLPQTVFSYQSAFVSTGLELLAVFEGGGTEAVSGGYTVTGADTSAKATAENVLGTFTPVEVKQSVLVSYQGKTTTYEITVLPPDAPVELVSITVTKRPEKTVYAFGEDLDLTGLVVTGTMSDGSTVDYVPGNAALIISGHDKEQTGTQSVLLAVKDKTTSVTVTVKGDPARLSAWDFLEAKRIYGFLETVDPATDFVVYGRYSNDPSTKDKIIDQDAEPVFIEGFKAQTPGFQKLLVTVADITKEYYIYVREPALASIAVEGLENSYAYGSVIDTDDLTVTGTWEDGATEEIEYAAESAGKYDIEYDFEGDAGAQDITVTVLMEDVINETSPENLSKTFEYAVTNTIGVTVEPVLEVAIAFTETAGDGFSISLPNTVGGPSIDFPVSLTDPADDTLDFVLSEHGNGYPALVILNKSDFLYSIAWKVDNVSVSGSTTTSATLRASDYTYKIHYLTLSWTGADSVNYTETLKFKVVY